MHFDFSAALVLGALVTGVIWAVDAIAFAPKRRAADADRPEPVLVDYARSFFPLIVIVLVLRSFVGEPFRIPSGSMVPTLLVGDFIYVNKYAYGLRLPVVDTKILDLGEPERGDVVVFRYPEDPSIDFVKRVIGLPGDHIEYRDKQLFVNGEPLPQTHLGAYGTYPVQAVQLRNETIGDVEHEIIIMTGRDTGPLEFSVPDGEYFVMGDNRDNSNDSREWGTVPERNLVGRAVVVWMSWVPGEGPMWSRIGTWID